MYWKHYNTESKYSYHLLTGAVQVVAASAVGNLLRRSPRLAHLIKVVRTIAGLDQKPEIEMTVFFCYSLLTYGPKTGCKD